MPKAEQFPKPVETPWPCPCHRTFPNEYQRCLGLLWMNHWYEALVNGIVKYRWALPCFQGDGSSGFPSTSWDTPSLSIPLTHLALVVVLLYVKRLLIQPVAFSCAVLMCLLSPLDWDPWEQGPCFITLHILHLRHYLKYGWHRWRFFDSIHVFNYCVAKHSPSSGASRVYAI